MTVLFNRTNKQVMLIVGKDRDLGGFDRIDVSIPPNHGIDMKAYAGLEADPSCLPTEDQLVRWFEGAFDMSQDDGSFPDKAKSLFAFLKSKHNLGKSVGGDGE